MASRNTTRVAPSTRPDHHKVTAVQPRLQGCSSWVFCFGVQRGKDLGHRFLECRWVSRHGIPHDVEIDIEVAVAYLLRMSVMTRQSTSGMRVADLVAYASCSFADDLYPVQQRVLQQFIGVEASDRPGRSA